MSYGRRKIFTDATEITKENVVAEVNAAYVVHCKNRNEIINLYRYYRNKTSILDKAKEVRPEINHKVGEARPMEAVKFYKGYVFGEPVQYVRRERSDKGTADDEIAAGINQLNSSMSDANKAACDGKMATWLLVCGTGYKMCLPSLVWTKGSDEPPFELYAPDPRCTFVVYNNGIEERPVMNVTYINKKNGDVVFTVYTRERVFTFKEGTGDVGEKPNNMGMLPIVEFPADSLMGVFEPALPIVDAINELQSNRLDDIVQFVNSLLAVLGAELSKEAYQKLYDWKMMFLPDGTDAKYLSANMSQADVQTLKDDLYQSFLTVCGMPNRNGGSSTSDNGVAVELRDGWQSAETRAKEYETGYKAAEKEFLKVVLRVMRDTVGTNLKLTDIDTHFTRRNYDNIATKSQVLVATLNSGKIHPEICFTMCGAFPDPESAYLKSKEWVEEQQKKEAERIANTRASAVPPVQQATDGHEGASTDPVSQV